MSFSTHIENPDVILIGSGVMSANLGAILKRLNPELTIQLYEVTEELAQESSNGWNNAGTGHAGICELSYTPEQNEDGTVDITKAIEVFQEFEQSLQFWGSAVADGMIDNPRDFIRPLPHISFVHGQKQVDFLKARFEGMSAHHFFEKMIHTADREEIKRWAPLLIEGREEMPVAATRMDSGTDVNFGVIAQKFVGWLAKQEGCGVATSHRVVGLKQTANGWDVRVKDLKNNRTISNHAKFVFIGAGGGSLPLLQKSKIKEGRGFGAFPVGGQWLVCDKPEIVVKHEAKVYGQAQDEAPTMAVPHLDTRVMNGKKSLLFGPFAAWTTKFLHQGGSRLDLPFSVKFNNLMPLLKTGIYNVPLVKYLIKEGLQSLDSRMRVLHRFYPDAKTEDWRLQDAGIRVQAIKSEDGEAGIVHYGTEVVTNAEKTISVLLGASPGASVCVFTMLQVVAECFPHLLESEEGKARVKEMIPTHGLDLLPGSAAEQYKELSEIAARRLMLTDAP